MKRVRLLVLNLGGLAGCLLGLAAPVHGWLTPVEPAGGAFLGVLLAGLLYDRLSDRPPADGGDR